MLNNLRVHHARPVKACVAKRTDEIEVFYLPRCSSELNPDEMANADLKRAVTTKAPARTTLWLVMTASGHARIVQKRPERIRHYSEHGLVRYAA